MKCKTCGYALWNLRTHVCPECGEAFKIEDFEFMPTTVRFCCPHCNQSYYGTDTKGLIVPREFDCVKCGRHIHMEEMVVLPAEGLSTRETASRVIPWLDHEGSGFFARWMRTIGWGFARGPDVGRSLPDVAAVAPAMGYFLLTVLTTLVLGTLPIVCVTGFAMRAAMSVAGGPAGAAGGAPVFWMFGGMAVFMLVVAAIGTVLMIGVSHLVLTVTGGASGGLSRTTESFCYTSGPLVMASVPCLGFYIAIVGWIWWAVSAGLALSKAHGTSTARSVIAALVPGIGYPALFVGAYLSLFFLALVRTGGPGATILSAAGSPQGQVSSLTMAWRTKASNASNSARPIHACEFLDTGFVNGNTFLVSSSMLVPSDVPVGSMTLADFGSGSFSLTPGQAAAVQAAASALPADVVAHRVGDFVFTYHGINLMSAPSGLWVVIADPLRNPPGPAGPNEDYVVGTVDGGSTVIASADFAAQLQAQNQLRAGQGLAPLPMPDTVTQDQPAVGSGN